MRALMAAAFLFGAATAAQGQDMPRITEALQRNFPERHAELAGKLAGETPANARQVVSETMDRFLEDYRADIVAAPGPRLIAVEADAGRMLRALGRQDMAFCAVVGDRGFFSPEALDGAPPPGLDDYGAALIEAAADRGMALRVVDINEPAIASLYERALILVRPDAHVCWRGEQDRHAQPAEFD